MGDIEFSFDAFKRLVTPLGRSLLLIGLLAWLLAVFGEWPVMQIAAITCLILWLVALVTVVIPGSLTGRATVVPARTVAGESAVVALSASTEGAVPVLSPVVNIDVGNERHAVRLPTVRRGDEVTEELYFTDLPRGVIPVSPARQERGDPIGLIRWFQQITHSNEILVMPRTIDLPTLPGGAIRDQEGRPSDEVSMSDLAFHALREYVPGDDLRHVHWRSSAKTDTLMVRQYLDSRRNHQTIVVDSSPESYRHDDDFELALSVAASFAIRAASDGLDLSFLCGAHAVTNRGAEAVLDATCRAELEETDLGASVRQGMRLAPETSQLVLVTGGKAGRDSGSMLRSSLPIEVNALLVKADHRNMSLLGRDYGVTQIDIAKLEDLPRLVDGANR
ncbi:MAG TPA: DUF58 domain-containing protein [Marmoricola sp.]|jgi:uncharacterized protein (DUF58 family)|nr:DUF58 domain-containing protein [Nocardioidaceae bacterium]MCB8993427.1 DUF58 domain-containing protein [Nocardioidaceae bacterium]MCO5324409.1 DUF58 domain-containing protein [Nocardioidaceae bacterium]HRV68582.1 DUF58 domain-containing protein [Marmoricola sp.]